MIVVVNENDDTVSLNGLSWDQIYFLDGIMLYAKEEFKSETLKNKAEEFLVACEAASEITAEANQ